MSGFGYLVRELVRPPMRRTLSERHLDGKYRALARAGSNINGVPQQVRQPLDDCETETETLAALARGIVELMELLENRLKLSFGNADPGVPDLDAQLVATPTAAEQDLALAWCISPRSRADCGSSARAGGDRCAR